ncbi:MAG TPA: MgtC/SapB family protein [Anaerolineae bacterium]|nr:MgtC/SapB family protein [Anaerolineae bacterium]
MTVAWEDILKIVLALVAGGLIGFEREFRDKAAGFRTLILICIGATIFTILSDRLADPPNARVAANIVVGVGFLGAGVILRDEKGGRIRGLTTAALVWLAAAVGMALGAGEYILAGVVVALTMVILWVLPKMEHVVDSTRDSRTYEVAFRPGSEKRAEVEALLVQRSRRVQLLHQARTAERVTATWLVIAHASAHGEMAARLMDDPEVVEVRC